MRHATGTYLDRILADTAERLRRSVALPTQRLRRSVALPSTPPPPQPTRGFAAALTAPGISLIAEYKRASPSRGAIRTDLRTEDVARAYEEGGARAMSVLTEPTYFHGSPADLAAARAACALPLLRKDFLIHPAQVFETVGRADAVLLIVAALTEGDLAELLAAARTCGLDALVEVHDRAEADAALAAGARILGINNRDLHTFTVDLGTTFALRPHLPAGITVVSESGIRSADDVRRMADAGVDAVLVGEALMTAEDQGAAARTLLGG